MSFPNTSRSYDQTRRAVHFWGYEGAIEHSFFVHEDALQRIDGDVAQEESALLAVFDRNRDRITKAAATAFRRGRKGSILLVANDF